MAMTSARLPPMGWTSLISLSRSTWPSALLLADSAEVFPWVAAARLGEPVELPSYLKPLLDRSGQLDMSAVHTRAHQLRSGGHGFHA